VQVMLQVPAAQLTLAPAPTVWVQVLPLHATLQPAPHTPLQVAPLSHVKRQLLVEAEQASKLHMLSAGQSHAVPAHTEPQPASASASSKAKGRMVMDYLHVVYATLAFLDGESR